MEVFFSLIVEEVEGFEEVKAPCHPGRSEESCCLILRSRFLPSLDVTLVFG
jgi:hypothetical protein